MSLTLSSFAAFGVDQPGGAAPRTPRGIFAKMKAMEVVA
jgi:hypothetical protein